MRERRCLTINQCRFFWGGKYVVEVDGAPVGFEDIVYYAIYMYFSRFFTLSHG